MILGGVSVARSILFNTIQLYLASSSHGVLCWTITALY